MAYTAQDKLEFAIKDAKYSIGQGRGNALSLAIQWVISKGGKLDDVYEVADQLFHFNQVSIDKDFQAWLKVNKPKIMEELGIVDFEKNIIQEGEKL